MASKILKVPRPFTSAEYSGTSKKPVHAIERQGYILHWDLLFYQIQY